MEMPILLQKKLPWGRGDGLEGCGEGLAPLLPSCRVGLEIRGGPHLCGWRDQRDACLSKLHKQSRGRLQSRRWGRHPGMAGTSRVQSLGIILGREPLPGDRTPSLGSPSTASLPFTGPGSRVDTYQSLSYPLPSPCPSPLLPTARTLTAVDSLDARVISKFPLSPSSAGTRMKTSVTFWKTSQCYKINTEPKNLSTSKERH